MSWFIDVNTEELQSAVQIARRANETISQVAALLNSVVIHNDWQCPERSEINSNTSRNRTDSLTMQTDAESLYNAILFASQSFLEAEGQLARSFDSVDSLIGQYLSLAQTASTVTNIVTSHIQSTVRSIIAPVRFQDLAGGFQSHGGEGKNI